MELTQDELARLDAVKNSIRRSMQRVADEGFGGQIDPWIEEHFLARVDALPEGENLASMAPELRAPLEDGLSTVGLGWLAEQLGGRRGRPVVPLLEVWCRAEGLEVGKDTR